MFITSLKTQAELIRNVFAPPVDPKWANYPLVLIERGYYRAVINSCIFAISTTILTIVLSVLAAFAFAAYQFFGKQLLFVLVLIGLMVSEVSILIPVYNLLKQWNLLNTYAGMILPQVALGLSFGIFLMTTFFREIPRDLVDAARLDGCTDLQILTRVMIPVAMPAINALAVIEFLWALEQLLLSAGRRDAAGPHAAQRRDHRFHGALHLQLRAGRDDLRDHVRPDPGLVPADAAELPPRRHPGSGEMMARAAGPDRAVEPDVGRRTS